MTGTVVNANVAEVSAIRYMIGTILINVSVAEKINLIILRILILISVTVSIPTLNMTETVMMRTEIIAKSMMIIIM